MSGIGGSPLSFDREPPHRGQSGLSAAAAFEHLADRGHFALLRLDLLRLLGFAISGPVFLGHVEFSLNSVAFVRPCAVARHGTATTHKDASSRDSLAPAEQCSCAEPGLLAWLRNGTGGAEDSYMLSRKKRRVGSAASHELKGSEPSLSFSAFGRNGMAHSSTPLHAIEMEIGSLAGKVSIRASSRRRSR